jgi:hypothetical protein
VDAIIRSISIVRSRRALAGLACLLICIRVIAVGICSTCFDEFDAPTSRAFYLHNGSDHDACHHGRAPVGPWVAWACEVTQDDADFVLPDSPLLPIIVSFLVPLTLLGTSRRDSLLLAGKGRSPPLRSLLP